MPSIRHSQIHATHVEPGLRQSGQQRAAFAKLELAGTLPQHIPQDRVCHAVDGQRIVGRVPHTPVLARDEARIVAYAQQVQQAGRDIHVIDARIARTRSMHTEK